MDETPDSRCDIRVGTSGYDYPEWEGSLYPRGLGRSEYLGAYSEAFETLELNFSYYGMPKPAAMRAMAARTRRPIDFSVKANQALTHRIDPAGWKAAAAEFASGVAPLAEEGRLCAVLVGFPFSFRYRDDERRYLDRLLKELSSFPLVVEFRNADWFSSRVIEGLKARGVGLCAVDLPRLDGLPPVSDLVTSDLAYVRFHGRNGEAWWTGDSGSRYEYRYSAEELSSWLPRLEAMSVEAKRLRVFFNNHRRGNAPADAKALLGLARAAKLL
ncbi:MAG: DUF72 domain-containing protein [Spirochaetes bacterium]|nr:DUF72 domain-containing protein [Spirochaetota bacterium]MBU1079881.1 DUF72 domain-containing protein [Spirochaetota bacterium]